MPDNANLDLLLEQARRGDRQSLVTLLERLAPEVRRRIASKMTGPWRSVLDEDDIMQVTFLEACLRFEKFTEGQSSGFLAWLTRLAENNRIDAIRALEGARRPAPSKRVTPPPTAGADSLIALVELLGASSNTPSRQAATSEAAQFLELALATLPPDYEKVIRLYDLEGLPAEEVGRRMNRSEGAVYMLRARAHDRLKESLGRESKFFSTPA
jgi:RNA polymerase sigma factor (sigma-70 family)